MFSCSDLRAYTDRRQEISENRSRLEVAVEEVNSSLFPGEQLHQAFWSWLAMDGSSIKEIEERAGHKTITMSARTKRKK